MTTKKQMSDRDIRDTVSSNGIAGGKSMLPRIVDGMRHVCYFRHALALDEGRDEFLPEHAYGRYPRRVRDDYSESTIREHKKAEPVIPIDKARRMWAVIQLVICTDLKLVQSSRECHRRRRFGFQERTRICPFILTYKSITNV